MNFGQVLTAMVTPFDQNGEVDFNAVRRLVDYLIEKANITEIESEQEPESDNVESNE